MVNFSRLLPGTGTYISADMDIWRRMASLLAAADRGVWTAASKERWLTAGLVVPYRDSFLTKFLNRSYRDVTKLQVWDAVGHR